MRSVRSSADISATMGAMLSRPSFSTIASCVSSSRRSKIGAASLALSVLRIWRGLVLVEQAEEIGEILVVDLLRESAPSCVGFSARSCRTSGTMATAMRNMAGRHHNSRRGESGTLVLPAHARSPRAPPGFGAELGAAPSGAPIVTGRRPVIKLGRRRGCPQEDPHHRRRAPHRARAHRRPRVRGLRRWSPPRKGKEGVLLARQEKPDAVLLDLMLPDTNGFKVCEELRRFDRFVPIIMLTARGAGDGQDPRPRRRRRRLRHQALQRGRADRPPPRHLPPRRPPRRDRAGGVRHRRTPAST